ncbi:clostripain-related cysteine peptidase [Lichenibacterium dinghuense]|uniref:clostripain-related cysteine peptidase n=1 Tax=Lichenibacterium dinghuense TaxID=2895977 RepID=UPI001F314C03|nr:clostripain-related cysteine peptidase [Lichenibacterium sp. 6Y81]
MIFMNGKNNLEPDALDNFHDMAKVGSSDHVNFVVELGRPKRVPHVTDARDGDWSGVRRYLVSKGSSPVVAQSLLDVGAGGGDVDMGRPKALAEFLHWARTEFPARHYMLVMWNHGQGWRLQLAGGGATPAGSSSGVGAAPVTPGAVPKIVGGFRAISSDDDTGSILYNREVQDVVAREFGSDRLDVLGFDACLMAMVETAYAFAPTVDVLVASEELEPGPGWPYAAWMARLVADPESSAAALGTHLVDAYHEEYRDDYLTTLSALSLPGLRTDLSGISPLADALRFGGGKGIAELRTARVGLASYGAPMRTSVDLVALLDRFGALTRDARLKARAGALRGAVMRHVIANYASTRSARPSDRAPYGSDGLAIYFPESRKAFLADYFHDGYSKRNQDRPVDFVRRETWSELIAKLMTPR